MPDEALLTYLAGGGSSAVVVFLYWFLGRLLDKYKPAYERRQEARVAHEAHRDKELSEMRGQVEFWQGEVEKCQQDVAELRVELRKMSAERHRFYDAIVRCTLEHPTTAEWWRLELADIQKAVGR